MNRTHSITTTTIDRWLMPHLAGVIAYAETDHVFALTLATWLGEERWLLTPTPLPVASRHLTPTSRSQADDITDWLMHELTTHPEARIARGALMQWATSYVIPTDLLARLSNESISYSKRSHTEPSDRPTTTMQLLLNEEWQETLPYDRLIAVTQSITQELVGHELRKASGKIDSLHPDTAEWCMAGSGATVLSVEAPVLQRVAAAAVTEDLHHVLRTDQYGIQILAVSPQVQDSFVDQFVG